MPLRVRLEGKGRAEATEGATNLLSQRLCDMRIQRKAYNNNVELPFCTCWRAIRRSVCTCRRHRSSYLVGIQEDCDNIVIHGNAKGHESY